MHDTIQTILTSEQKENVISLMSSFVFGPQVVFKADFSWLETCVASFEVSDANALPYCSFITAVSCSISNNTQNCWAKQCCDLLRPFAWNHNNVGTCCVYGSLKPVKLLGPCKRTQHCWPTTPNIVGALICSMCKTYLCV